MDYKVIKISPNRIIGIQTGGQPYIWIGEIKNGYHVFGLLSTKVMYRLYLHLKKFYEKNEALYQKELRIGRRK